MALMVETTIRKGVQANLEFRWTALIRTRLESLTDDEWEPSRRQYEPSFRRDPEYSSSRRYPMLSRNLSTRSSSSAAAVSS